MKATDYLMKEHRLIERAIAALEAGTVKLEAGNAVRPGFFLDAVDFVSEFADGCHHKKEEDILFITMAGKGVPVQGGPIGVMLTEHEQGRNYNRGIKAGVEKLQAGNPSGKEEIIRNGRGYAALLRQHIAKEDGILFPMAERVIPLPEQEQMWQDFERAERDVIGEGTYEKYHLIVENLEHEISNL